MSPGDVILPLVAFSALFVAIVSAKAAERSAERAQMAASAAQKAVDDMVVLVESVRRRGLL